MTFAPVPDDLATEDAAATDVNSTPTRPTLTQTSAARNSPFTSHTYLPIVVASTVSCRHPRGLAAPPEVGGKVTMVWSSGQMIITTAEPIAETSAKRSRRQIAAIIGQ